MIHRQFSSASRPARPSHSRLRYRHIIPRLAAASRPAASAPAPAAVDSVGTAAAAAWPEFASNVSGEWEGVTASFSPDGSPQQLPEHYVPEAFREWGVELWDWQSQCSCLAPAPAAAAADEASAIAQQRLKSVVRRLMPTVGCEADAIAFTEEDASSSSSSSSGVDDAAAASGQALLCAADGSYSSGPAALPPTGKEGGPGKFQVEHCFALPPAAHSSSSSSPAASRYRLKVVQQFRKNWATGAWVLDTVDLHRERFDGPYTGKRELAGCGGGQPGIAQLPVLQANSLGGKWTAQEPVVTSSRPAGSNNSLSCLDEAGAAPEGAQLTLLPLGAWSAVQLSAAGQLQRAEAGVLLGLPEQQLVKAEAEGSADGSSSSSRLVSCRVYDTNSARLQAASLGGESKA